MKISSVTLTHLRMPLILPFETSFGRALERDCILIAVRSEGFTGYGECVADREPGYAYETSGTAWHILSEFIIPSINREWQAEVRDFRQRVSTIRGHQMAKAAFEMALWDLAGKTAGKSLRILLGGARDKVEVGVSVGIQQSTKDLVKRVSNYIDDGYRRIKIKIRPGRDTADVEAVRKAFPEIRLQVDANSAYTLDTASTLQPLDLLDLLLIEQPLYEDDFWDHARLQKRFNTPICLDESILSCRHARVALEIQACRVINIKAGRVGGLTEATAIHDLCLEKGVPVWCGGMLETGVGRAANLALASLPGFTLPGDISASRRYYARDITNETFTLNPDSTIDVPEAPGLGVSLDLQAVCDYSLRSETFEM